MRILCYLAAVAAGVFADVEHERPLARMLALAKNANLLEKRLVTAQKLLHIAAINKTFAKGSKATRLGFVNEVLHAATFNEAAIDSGSQARYLES